MSLHASERWLRCKSTSAVRIFESNRIVTPVFDSIRNEYNYLKFLNTYHHRFLTYLTEWHQFFTVATTPSKLSNQQNLLLTMVQVLYLLSRYIDPLWPTEYWNSYNHKNSWIYLTSTYYWWLLIPTITIRFHSKFQTIAQLFDSIRNEKTLFAQH